MTKPHQRLRPFWQAAFINLLAVALSIFFMVQAQAQSTQLNFKSLLTAYYAQDFETSLNGFLTLSSQGNDQATLFVGRHFYYGFGVPQDFAEALNWFQKAAPNEPEAQEHLGLMYAKGEGTPSDLVLGFMWLILADNNGDDSAQMWKTVFAKSMTATQLAEAGQKAELCISQNYQACR